MVAAASNEPSAPPLSSVTSTSTETSTSTPSHSSPSSIEKTKVNLAYLALGSKAAVTPSSITTRSLLTTARYILRYAVRRLLRIAKYAAIGGIIAALGTGVLGAVGSGVAFFAAPSLGVGVGIGVATALVKFGWRHRGNHFRTSWWHEMETRAREGRDAKVDEETDADENTIKEKREAARRVREDVWMRV